MTPRRSTALLLLVVITALNLRPAVTTLGPLLPQVRVPLGMSGTVAGLLTALPPLCFAAFGPLAPMLARRFGPLTVVAVGMGLLATGLAARAQAPNSVVFLLLTALGLAGIAVSNVLMPAIISQGFPTRIGQLTGLYSMALTGGAALTAAAAVPVTRALGGDWRNGLAVWALAAAVAGIWALACRKKMPVRLRGTGAVLPALRRSRTARAMAIFFGTISTAAYTVMGWLPQIFQDAGISAGRSGLLLALAMSIAVPVSYVLPTLAARRGDQRSLVAALTAVGLLAYGGLAFAPATMPWLWAFLVGLAGAAFPLGLTMIGLRARTHDGVARLSSFAQSSGYLMSIPGPIIVGALYQHTGSWHAPLTLLTVLLLPQLLAGLRAARLTTIEDELGPGHPSLASAAALDGPEDDEPGVGGDDLAVAEEPAELHVVAEMPVADDPELAVVDQRLL
jgi:CP family cyanate transporter-like MFS transporter